MSYKKSIYNVVVDELENGRKLIYNTYSGIFGIMDKKTQNIYENIEEFSSESGLDEEALQNIHIMGRSGYIVNTEKDELSSIKLERAKGRLNPSILKLVIGSTMDCNMCCPYCFEDNRDIVMSEETQEQLYTFVKASFDRDANIKTLEVVWYGGEPLMQKEIIYSLSKRFIDLCAEKGKHYRAGIITNATLLDAETAKRLVEFKVDRAQITVDGMKEIHNKRRILVSGEDSFEIIMKNIDDCKEMISIHVRVNVDKENIDNMDELVNYFYSEKGWKSNPRFYLAPVEGLPVESGGGSVDESECLTGEEFAEAKIKSIKAGYAVDRSIVDYAVFPRRRIVFCHGEAAHHYIIDPEGFYYNCYKQIGIKEQSTGHISKPFVCSTEYGKWLSVDVSEKCEECEYLPMCMGGCGLHRINGNDPVCFYASYAYKDFLKLAYQDYLHQKSKSESIAGN